MILPAGRDRQALVPCKDMEQRMLDHTFHCAQSRGTVPALKSVKIPVRVDHMSRQLTHRLHLSSGLSVCCASVTRLYSALVCRNG